MAPNDRIIVADILPTRLREEADKVGTEQASLLREAAGRIRTLTDWVRNLRDSLRKVDAEVSRLRHCDEALRMLGFNDEHCKTDDPLLYAEAVLQSLQVGEQSAMTAASAERERIVKLLRDFARAARARGGPLDDDQARGEWWKEITTAEAFARKIEDGSLADTAK